MPRKSVVLLSKIDQDSPVRVTGPAVRAASYYGITNGLHTISVHMNNFIGGYKVQGTLHTNPGEEDWFDIELTETDENGDELVKENGFILEPQSDPNINVPITSVFFPDPVRPGRDLIRMHNFKGNFVFLRMIVSREHLDPVPDENNIVGNIDRVLLAF